MFSLLKYIFLCKTKFSINQERYRDRKGEYPCGAEVSLRKDSSFIKGH